MTEYDNKHKSKLKNMKFLILFSLSQVVYVYTVNVYNNSNLKQNSALTLYW